MFTKHTIPSLSMLFNVEALSAWTKLRPQVDAVTRSAIAFLSSATLSRPEVVVAGRLKPEPAMLGTTRQFLRFKSALAMHALQACNIYVSEGSNRPLLSCLERIASGQDGAVLVNTFVDSPYNRTGFTLVAAESQLLADAAVALAKAALQKLDLRTHAATHPRLGTVDHISCHPLTAAAELQETALIAHKIGEGISSVPSAAPVFLYGEASREGATLASIRRQLGYFKGSAAGSWKGNLLGGLPPGLSPDFGPREINHASGVVCVGAVPWVTNFNICLRTSDVAAGREIAAAVSERAGGIPGVQAMALPHEPEVEIACNLLKDGETLMEAVHQEVGRQCRARGIQLGEAYRIGKSPAQYAEMAIRQLFT